MPRVPYNPAQAVAPAQSQPRIDNSGVIQAIGLESQAKSRMIQSFQGAIDAGMALRQDKIERDTFADQQRFESVATQAEQTMNQKLDSIEIADGVDFQSEAESIRKEYVATLQDWVQAPGNVRHKQKAAIFTSQINAVENASRIEIANRNNQYQSQLNIGAGKRGIETGIQANDPGAIERGVMTLHLEKVRGYESADEASMMYDRHLVSAKKMADERTMTVAENLLADGNYKGFSEAIDAMELPTVEEKKQIKREKASTYAYNSARLTLDGLENLQDLKSFASDPEKIGDYKGLTANHRATLQVMANGKIRQIERAQKRNAESFLRSAAKGEFDPESFDEMAVLDNEDGLPQDQIVEIQNDIQKALRSYEKEQAYDVLEKEAKKDEKYVKTLNELSASMFRPEDFDLNQTLKKIRKLEVGDPIKADLLSKAFGVSADKQAMRVPQDYDGKDIVPFLGIYRRLTGKTTEQITQPEIDTLRESYLLFQDSVEQMGNWEGINDEVNRVQKEIKTFFDRNMSPNEKEIEEAQIRILKPLVKKMIEHEKYSIRQN